MFIGQSLSDTVKREIISQHIQIHGNYIFQKFIKLSEPVVLVNRSISRDT